MSDGRRKGLYPHEGLLPMVLDLHMNITGNSDATPKTELIRCRDVLKVVVDTWDSSPKFSERFDNAVKALCESVLEEAGRPENAYLFSLA
jgi:hypothetical protein